MLIKFASHIDTNLSFLQGKKLLIACSGGVDSVVLVSLCHAIGLEFCLAHCNFKLRGNESDMDANFVRGLATDLKTSFFLKEFDTAAFSKNNGISIQMAARELRYQWFKEIAKEHTFQFVLTAHHLDDSLETFLINLSRGTGIEGLLGIPETKGIYVRPLLPFSRDQILRFAKKKKIAWKEDSSNESTKYLRNKLRHEVIPNLKSINPAFLQNFATTLSNLKQTENLIANEICRIKDEVFSYKDPEHTRIDINKLLKYGTPKLYSYELLKDYGFTAWEDIVSILDSQPGKQIFSRTHRLVKDRDSLLLVTIQEDVPDRYYTIHDDESVLMIPSGLLKFKEVPEWSETNLATIYVDKEKLKYPLVVRKWKEGDYFYPLGMKGKKKVSKYFKDEKLSLLAKERVWLLCSGDDVVWIINYRADDRFRITPQTKKIVKVTITR